MFTWSAERTGQDKQSIMAGTEIWQKKIINDITKYRSFVFPELLEKAGYKQVPNHSYSKIKNEQNWISNTYLRGARFPRFHIIKNEAWYIHYDSIKEHFKDGVIIKGKIIDNEIKRLYELFKNNFPDKFKFWENKW